MTTPHTPDPTLLSHAARHTGAGRVTPRRAAGAAATAGRRLAVGALCAAAGTVLAQAGPGTAEEASPYSVGGGLGLEHDDNLFRAPQGVEQADTHTVANVFGAVDQRYGRQRLQANAALRDNRYRDRRELNHLGYSGKLAWEGSTVGDLSWKLSHETDRKLASYGTVQDPAFRGANTETIDQTLAGAQLGLEAQWVARLALSHRRVEHTAQAFELERVRLDSVGASVEWNPLGPLSASVGPRTTRGRVPTASDGIERTFQRRDLDFGVHWTPTGQSDLRARLSLTRQRYDTPGQGDFSGATGQVDWQWAVSGRTRIGAALSRETGSETAFLATPGAPQTLRADGDSSQLTTALRAHADHDLTGKIALGLELQYARRQLTASSLLPDGSVVQTQGSDRSALARLGLRYAATRSTVLTCSVAHERRSSATPLSSSYIANTVGCNAQVTLRWS